MVKLVGGNLARGKKTLFGRTPNFRNTFETRPKLSLQPGVTLDVFVDDSHQSAQGAQREARKLIVAAGRTFTKDAQKQLRVRFAKKKNDSDRLVTSEAWELMRALVKPERGCERLSKGRPGYKR